MEVSQIVINGNNIDLLKDYPDNHFDSIVTDPPYGLGKEPNAAELMKDWVEFGYHEVKGTGFMGKEWDAFVPQPVFWKEVFRVLKHGGHVLSFFGTRTYDWGVMSMRFAGFEVRDCIQWLYGSGFPKSHNISKAIDKMPANNRLVEFSELLKEKRNQLSLSISEADDLICGGSTMYNFLEGRNINGVLKIYPPNKDFYEKIKCQYKIEGWDDIIENNLEVIGSEKGNFGFQNDGERWNEERDIKTTTTEAAKQWDGWGTALKPAHEDIVLARKPLEKGLSIAENILKWGVGGINIDASRIGSGNPLGRFPANIILTHHEDCECKGTKKVKPSNGSGKASEKGGGFSKGMFGDGTSDNIGGGFTDADGMEEVENWDCHEDCPIRILDEQSGVLKSGAMNSIAKGGQYNVYSKMNERRVTNPASVGGASRFFYVAKASKAERNKGLDGFESKQMAWSNQAKAELKRGNTEFADETKMHNKVQERINFHPTVKPIKLMQYLVKMITPPNGVVLDPFCGSGTTGVACKLDGFNFVGLEQDHEYYKIAKARIDNTKVETEKQMKLWD